MAAPTERMDQAPAVLVACGTRNKTKVGAVRETLAMYPAFDQVEIHAFDVDSGVGGQPMTMEPIIRGAQNRAVEALKALKAARAQTTADVSVGVSMPAPKYISIGIESGLYRLIPFSMHGKKDSSSNNNNNRDENESSSNGSNTNEADSISAGDTCTDDHSTNRYSGWYDVCVCSIYDGVKHSLGTSCAFQIPPKIMRHVLDDKGTQHNNTPLQHFAHYFLIC